LSAVIERAVCVHTKGHDSVTFGPSRKVRRSTTTCIWQTSEQLEFTRNRLANLLQELQSRVFRTRRDTGEVRAT
jgi:hypothetical protein